MDDIAIFKPSSFFIIIHTSFGLDIEIQLVPVMQIYIKADVSFKEKLKGLCGDFNDVEADDFRTSNGIVEGTAVTFANTWKVKATCPDVKAVLEDPCALSILKEKFAKNWCLLLSDPTGMFSACHSKINPEDYENACVYDTCACENSEDCMCAAISSYVHACAAEGISFDGWRSNMCSKYTQDCPSTFEYKYNMTGCGHTCRSLSQPDLTCPMQFTLVDGCGCAEGTYLDESGVCVSASQCSCYMGDTPVQPGQVVMVSGQSCTCHSGKLSCIGQHTIETCSDPMVFFNCSSASTGEKGAECQNTCLTLDTECMSTQCTSGCVCPDGLLSDGKGGCVKEDDCPCSHNGELYNPGQTITVNCNTCTCKSRNWECTEKDCTSTCTIYGEGHYITFDQKRFTFNGDCRYIFAQDYCGNDMDGTFRVLTEMVCAATESVCSTAVKLFLGNTEIILSDESVKVIKQKEGSDVLFKVHTMGLYLVIEAKNGLVLIWDKKTTLMVRLSSTFKRKVCGLCGNFDGNIKNDFTTQRKEVVTDATEFGNSWRVSTECPNANTTENACSLYSHKKAWALKHCDIIKSDVFALCHSKVDPQSYYDACVRDTCACNTGGDCECFCSTVAAYAAACNESGVCVKWRTPTICPVFCDFYNPDGECEWHYAPCGRPCMKTCRNPSGTCYSELPPLEGCYPSCPSERSYLEEVSMKCVSKEECGCYDDKGKHYKDGELMPANENCYSCYCSVTQTDCTYDVHACKCFYNNIYFKYGDEIYNTHDGNGTCITAVCGKNGNIIRDYTPCQTLPTPSTTVFVFTRSETTTELPSTKNSHKTSSITTEAVSTILTVTVPGFSQITRTTKQLSSSMPPFSTVKEKTTVTKQKELNSIQTTQKTTSKPITPSRVTESTPVTVNPLKTTTAKTMVGSSAGTVSTIATMLTEKPLLTTEYPTKPMTVGDCFVCKWSSWINNQYPGTASTGGDREIFDNINDPAIGACKQPIDIECRAEQYRDIPLKDLGQKVTCDLKHGLICNKEDQGGPRFCLDYEIRVKCCHYICTTNTKQTSLTPPTTSTTLSHSTSTNAITGKTTEEQKTVPHTIYISETTATSSTPKMSTSTVVFETTTTGPPSKMTTTSEENTATASTPSVITETSGKTTTNPIFPVESKTPIISTTTGVFETTTVPPSEITTPFEVNTATTSTPTVITVTTEKTTTNPIFTVKSTTEQPSETAATYTIPIISTNTVVFETTTTGPPSKTTTTSQEITAKPSTPPLITITTEKTTTNPIFTVKSTTEQPSETAATYTIPIISTNTVVFETTTTGPPSKTTTTSQEITAKPSTPPLITITTEKTTTNPMFTVKSTIEQPSETIVTFTTPIISTNKVVFETTTTGPPSKTTTTSQEITARPGTPPLITITTEKTTTNPMFTVKSTTEQPSETIVTFTTPIISTNTVVFETTTSELPTTPITTIGDCFVCKWSSWINNQYPGTASTGGDREIFDNITDPAIGACKQPIDIECRAEQYRDIPLKDLGQKVTCDLKHGLICNKEDQGGPRFCLDYEIRVKCCHYICTTNTKQTSLTPPTTSTTLSHSTSTNAITGKTTEEQKTVPHTIYISETTATSSTPKMSTSTVVFETTTTGPPSKMTTTSEENTATASTPSVITETSGKTTTNPIFPVESKTPIISTTTGVFETTTVPPSEITTPFEVNTATTSTPTVITVTTEKTTTNPIFTVKSTTEQPSETAATYTIPIISTNTVVFETTTTGPPSKTTTTSQEITAKPSTPPLITITTEKTTTNPMFTVKSTIEQPSETIVTFTTPIISTNTVVFETTTTGPPSKTTTTSQEITARPGTPPLITITTEKTTTNPMFTVKSTTEQPSETIVTFTTPIISTNTVVFETTTSELPTTPITTIGDCFVCKWSSWINNQYPGTASTGGDREIFDNITDPAIGACKQPIDIECRAEQYRDIPLKDLGQKVTCDLKHGLICNKEDQGGPRFCLDYEIRVKCCHYICTTNTKQTSLTPPTTSTTLSHSTSTNAITGKTTEEQKTVPHTIYISETTATSSTPKMSTSTVVFETTTTGPPSKMTTTSEENTATASTPSVITETSGKTTTNPIFPVESKTPIISTNTVVFETTTTGPPSKTTTTSQEITAKPSTPPLITITTEKTTTNPIFTVKSTTEQPSETAATYTIPIISTNTVVFETTTTGPPSKTTTTSQEITAKPSTPPLITITTEKTTTNPMFTVKSTIEQPSETIVTFTTPIISTNTVVFETTTTGPPSKTTTTSQEITARPGTPPLITITTEKTTTNPMFTVKSTTEQPSETIVTFTTPIISTNTVVFETTTSELPTTPITTIGDCFVCKWSSWINNQYPGTASTGGDREIFDNITDPAIGACKQPIDIECRAEQYRDIPLKDLGQKVTCDLKHGLICNKEDQGGPRFCLDYEIRVKCCHYICTTNTKQTSLTPPTTSTTLSHSTSTNAITGKTTEEQKTVPHTIYISETTATSSTPKMSTSTVVFETTTTGPPSKMTTTSEENTATASTPSVITETSGKTTTNPIFPVESTTEQPSETAATYTIPIISTNTVVFETTTTGPPSKTTTTSQEITAKPSTPPLITITTEKTTTNPMFTVKSTIEQPSETIVTFTTPIISTNTVVFETTTTGPPSKTTTTSQEITARPSTPPLITITTEKTTTNPIFTVKSTTEQPSETIATYTIPIISTNTVVFETTTTGPPSKTTTTSQEITAKPSTPPLITITTEKTTTNPMFTVKSTTEQPSETIATFTTPIISTNTVVFETTTTGPPSKTTTTSQEITARPGTPPLITITTEKTTTNPMFTVKSTTEQPSETAATSTAPKVSANTVVFETTTTGPPSKTTTTFEENTSTTRRPSVITVTTEKTTIPIFTVKTTTEQASVATSTAPIISTSTVVPSASSTLGRTTPCSCKYLNQTYYPDSHIYNKTDKGGWCFIAHCSLTCKIEYIFQPCNVTTPPRPPTSPSFPISTASSSTPVHGRTTTSRVSLDCLFLKPPRKNGESWKSDKCTTEKCENGKVILNHVPCKQVTIPVCENNQPPVRVYDEGGCCFHYECRCVCSGWGDPHYQTFDGEYYSFQKNCTYVLIKEIIPRHNFKIHIDNENCNPSGTVTCAKALNIFYKNDNITLTQKRGLKTVNMVFINGKQVTPAYSTKDLIITSTAIELLLKIPEIEAVVTFKGLLFSVELPFSLFYGNTEGQCGTCDNNRKNDCRLPDGSIHPLCSEMAFEWRVPDSSKPYCNVKPPVVNPPPGPTPSSCKPEICDILMSKVFEECHKKIPPKAFYEACKFDVCHMSNISAGCSSLEAYALMCAEISVCVSWRKATNGKCEYKCPQNKVYKPCGPTVVPTCNARYNEKSLQQCQGEGDDQNTGCTQFMEGCFCPDGMTLFSPTSDICVSSCCTGPDGQPKQLGEKWQVGCKQCVCDSNTQSVECRPLACPNQEPIKCTEDGEVLVNRTVDCCERLTCECDKNSCSPQSQECKLGFELKVHVSNESCCPVFSCVPKGVCVYNDTEYKPDKTFSKSTCEICHCTDIQDPSTQLNTVDCHQKECSDSCDKGFVHMDQPGQCCGSCIPIGCVFYPPEGSSPVVLEPSESWSPPNDNCIKYDCQKVNGDFIVSRNQTTCPEYDPDNCIPGTEKTDANGCCKTCTPRYSCQLNRTTTFLVKGNCKSIEPVELTSCEGSCGASWSKYSVEDDMMMHSCSCCKELATSNKTVEMICADDNKQSHTYILVEECGCEDGECEEEDDMSTEENEGKGKNREWKRKNKYRKRNNKKEEGKNKEGKRKNDVDERNKKERNEKNEWERGNKEGKEQNNEGDGRKKEVNEKNEELGRKKEGKENNNEGEGRKEEVNEKGEGRKKEVNEKNEEMGKKKEGKENNNEGEGRRKEGKEERGQEEIRKKSKHNNDHN
ncbi:mucin-5AC isoform X2 [Oryzias latipes]|uniref:mucin-5AC isoform X2 n=1 Tax=Oryzias latipes TaxID=8090 RepID=UPI000CE1AD32|nr:mucin-5AC isoform X2 [Oryzias latipes]